MLHFPTESISITVTTRHYMHLSNGLNHIYQCIIMKKPAAQPLKQVAKMILQPKFLKCLNKLDRHQLFTYCLGIHRKKTNQIINAFKTYSIISAQRCKLYNDVYNLILLRPA
jgi:hypothetical protein